MAECWAAPEWASVLGVPHGFAVSLSVQGDHGVLAGLHMAGSVAAARGAPASLPLLALAMLYNCRAVPMSLRPVAQLLVAASHSQSLRELPAAPRSVCASACCIASALPAFCLAPGPLHRDLCLGPRVRPWPHLTGCNPQRRNWPPNLSAYTWDFPVLVIWGGVWADDGAERVLRLGSAACAVSPSHTRSGSGVPRPAGPLPQPQVTVAMPAWRPVAQRVSHCSARAPAWPAAWDCTGLVLRHKVGGTPQEGLREA